MVHSSSFGCEHLAEYPVWSEYYDWNERDEILSWGVEESYLDEQLAPFFEEDVHPYYQLVETDPFPDRQFITVRARLLTHGGHWLSGAIIQSCGAAPHCLMICLGTQSVYVNRSSSFSRDRRTEFDQMREFFSDPDDMLFPMAYDTDYTDESGDRIAGVFELEEDSD